MSKLHTYAANTRGRDFICSDIHGHFSLLEERLARLGFDAGKDRLFSLGDLIDRGEESPRVLEFLQYPWVHAILGNHEVMLMRAYQSNDPQVYRWWYYWGGDWAETLTRGGLGAYFEAFKRLPVAIELGLRDNRHVALVHAQLPDKASWPNIRDQLMKIPGDAADPEACVSGRSQERLIAEMLWSKSQVYADAKQKQALAPVQGIDHVFHGHCIVYDEPQTVGNRTFMDLGSYETGEIACIDPVEFLRDTKPRNENT